LRTTRHRSVDHARRKQLRSLSTEVQDLLEAEWGDPAGVGSPENVEALKRCVGKLDAPARDLLQMKYSDGLTAAAIAARMRRSIDAVYQNLSRLHRALRACVERSLAAPNYGGRP
jgi:DNA-directed RNA polymerase specialized sigma24 family protein